jgi:hypothetical protein
MNLGSTDQTFNFGSFQRELESHFISKLLVKTTRLFIVFILNHQPKLNHRPFKD